MKATCTLAVTASCLLSLALAACGREPQRAAPGSALVPRPETLRTASALPRVIVHKNPSCGCCGSWVEHLRRNGFPVEVRDVDNLDAVKTRVGIPPGLGSCYTAEVGGYFVEGHVPAEDIKRLLAQQPRAKGLALPGMPLGSPGMEHPSGRTEAYVVRIVAPDGTAREFARHGH